MDVYRTEEEQVEAIKKWWKANGNNILIGVGLAIVIVMGWQWWQDRQRVSGESASIMYMEMLEATKVASAPGANKTESVSTVLHLTEKLKQEHEGSTYAQLAALMSAKYLVESDKAEEAGKELRWLLTKKPSEPLRLIATLRLAKVLVMQEKYDDALSMLDSVKPGPQLDAFEELKGDIFLLQGNEEKAHEAYVSATKAAEEKEAQRPILKMKLDNLATH